MKTGNKLSNEKKRLEQWVDGGGKYQKMKFEWSSLHWYYKIDCLRLLNLNCVNPDRYNSDHLELILVIYKL